MKKKTALLAGASGLIGRHCLQFLLDSDYYNKVTILVRNQLQIESEKLIQVVADFERLEDFVDDMAADDVFCCLGTTMKKARSKEMFRKVDYDYPVKIARISADKGAVQFSIVTAIGADSGSSFFYNRVKGDVEDSVNEAGFRSVNIFRPSLLLGERKESRPGEKAAGVFSKASAFAMIGPLRKYRAIEGRTVASVMVKVTAEGSAEGINIYESGQIQEIFNALSKK